MPANPLSMLAFTLRALFLEDSSPAFYSVQMSLLIRTQTFPPLIQAVKIYSLPCCFSPDANKIVK